MTVRPPIARAWGEPAMTFMMADSLRTPSARLVTEFPSASASSSGPALRFATSSTFAMVHSAWRLSTPRAYPAWDFMISRWSGSAHASSRIFCPVPLTPVIRAAGSSEATTTP